MLEREMLERLKLGDERAFSEIFQLYIKRVYQFVYGYLKHRFDAEDVTQVVFKKLWEKRSQIDVRDSISGYLFTIAYNATIDHMRKNSHNQRNVTIENESLLSIEERPGIPNSHKLQSHYETCIKLLPNKRREIYLLSRHEGLTNKQIAERLNISIKTVEHQIRAALDFLRSYFRNLDE